MARKLTEAAIIYDFDGTLSPINMQEHEFIPKLGMNHDKFWKSSEAIARDNNANEILCYMHLMLKEATHKNIKVRKDSIQDYGKDIELFDGVKDWFERINSYAKENNVKLSHYIISSGIKPLIEGTSIAKNFEKIFACDFIYDADGKPIAPGVAVDYTAKTQYIFRINKGCLDQWDNSMINDFVPMEERPIPIENMIYIGDGPTDIPAMKMTSQHNGLSICVYKPNTRDKKKQAEKFLNECRADCIASADYRANKALDQIVKARILYIATKNKYQKILLRNRQH